jgi:hypothetical protein
MSERLQVIVVAATEAECDALHRALVLPEVLVVAGATPDEASVACEAFSPDFVVALEGVALPEVGVPVVWTAAPEEGLADVQRYLDEGIASVPIVPETSPGSVGASLAFARVPERPDSVAQSWPAPRASGVRIGFYGRRGGVGTTTAAVTAARLLQGAGYRVALFDAPRRGDPFLMLGGAPGEEPWQLEEITVHSGPPSPQGARSYPAVVVDGGRERRDFSALWIPLEAPLTPEEIRKLLGL